MPFPQRFQNSVLSTIADGPRSAFAGPQEKSRMDQARKAIFSVRSTWDDPRRQRIRENSIKTFLTERKSARTVPQDVENAILNILKNHNRYADMVDDDIGTLSEEQYAGLRLYCSEEGYSFLFSLASSLLRSEAVTEDELVTIATLVEYLTIELYNLRLKNINKPLYQDFTGTVYRGMSVAPNVVDDFRAIAQHPVLPNRSFSIPLAMISATTDEITMRKFADRDDSADRLHWIIHVRGIRPELLQRYIDKYPDSVISSICAMPIDGISDFRDENEVLLRGPFFHMLRVDTSVEDGKRVHTCEMVMLNSNRDHGTELGSDDGEKAPQRVMFGRIVRATRYVVCAELTARWSTSKAEEYSKLAEGELRQLEMN